MTTITRSALVMYSAERMFDLVNDVGHYPEFLKGCESTRVIGQSDDFIEAELTLSMMGIRQRFTTRNDLQRPVAMKMKLVEGPFSTFSGFWQFDRLTDDACKVSLNMEFTVNNVLAGAALSAAFKQIANNMVDAFVERAQVIYG